LFVQLGANSFIVDVTVRHPGSITHLRKAQSQLGVAVAAEKEKHELYRELGARMDATVVPFAMETHGALGADAVRFIHRIARFNNSRSTLYSSRDMLEGMMGDLAVVVQRGNARLITLSAALANPARARPNSFRHSRPIVAALDLGQEFRRSFGVRF
jgi:hypothetical protein